MRAAHDCLQGPSARATNIRVSGVDGVASVVGSVMDIRARRHLVVALATMSGLAGCEDVSGSKDCDAPTWEVEVGYDRLVTHVSVASSGKIFVGGLPSIGLESDDVGGLLTTVSEAGDVGSDWSVFDGSPSNGSLWTLKSLAATPNGEVACAVLREDSYDGYPAYEGWLAIFDASGDSRWLELSGSDDIADTVDAIATGSNGIFVTGRNLTGDVDGFVSRFDAEGTALWTRSFGTSGEDVPTGIAPHAESDGVYVAGKIGFENGAGSSWSDLDWRAFLVRYAAETGEIDWASSFDVGSRVIATDVDDEGNV